MGVIDSKRFHIIPYLTLPYVTLLPISVANRYGSIWVAVADLNFEMIKEVLVASAAAF